MWYFGRPINDTYLSLQILEPRERDMPENTHRWRIKRKLALLLIKLVGKHGFKCGLKRLRDTPAKFRMPPPFDPGSAHTQEAPFL